MRSTPISGRKTALATALFGAEFLDLRRIRSLAHGLDTTRRSRARRPGTELVWADFAETSRFCSMLEDILV